MKKGKKKFSFKKVFIFLILIVVLYFGITFLLSIKTKNIIILNNDYYSDEVIIETAGIENYPSFLTLSRKSIKKKLKKLDLIEDVKVHKKLGFVLEIEVKEKKILYYIRSKEQYRVSDNNTYELEDVMGYPTLINYVPESIEKTLVKELSKVDTSIIKMISEIEYSKTDYDEKRFLLYMNDGRQVYITVLKADILNKYVDIIKKLGNKKGILYLDNGNYFEIKE